MKRLNGCKISDSVARAFRYCAVSLLVLIMPSTRAFAEFVYVVNQTANAVNVYDSLTFVEVPGSPFPTGGTGSSLIVANPAGTRLFITNQTSQNFSVLDATTGALITAPISTGGAGPFGIAINPAGTRLYIVNEFTGNFSVFDANTLAPIGLPIFTGGGGPQRIAINSAGTLICIPNVNTGNLSVFDANTLLPFGASPFLIGGNPHEVVFSPDGTLVYITDVVANTVRAYETVTFTATTAAMSTDLGPFDIAVSPDGSLVYVVNLAGDTIDLFTGVVLGPVGGSPLIPPQDPFGIAINSAGTLLYIATTSSGTINRFDATSPFTLQQTLTNPGAVYLGIILNTPPPLTPASLTGHQKKNDFGCKFERFNVLKWKSPEASLVNIAGYFVYRDGVRIATLGASAHKYKDHNRKEGALTLYSITSFDANGVESAPVNVEIK